MDEAYNTNKEERKRLRALRVEARHASGDDEATSKLGADAGEEARRSKGAQQIVNSLAHLDKKKSGGIENMTAIRVAADWREAQRRVAEEKQRQARLQRLQEEAVRSGKQNAAVEMRWAELLDQNMPQELHDEIEAQKAACSDIIASKDTLIREFQLQLKLKDEEYVKALKQQADDVEALVRRMRLEFKELQEEYEVELEAIEDAFLTERDDVLQANKVEIDALFEKRREMELLYMDKKRDREERYQREIEDLLVKDSEEYNKLKIKLETDIQTLEQQLEEMRATYQLNTEKLEYNYRVLTERDNENSNTLAQLKRKQNKLKDVLSGLVAKYHETDARDRRKNDELTDEYRRITKQYRDLQAKFRHFELSDQQRFEKVWQMHEDEVNDLVSKVLQADEIIHKQQLGWHWTGPNLTLLLRDTEEGEEEENDDDDGEEATTAVGETALDRSAHHHADVFQETAADLVLGATTTVTVATEAPPATTSLEDTAAPLSGRGGGGGGLCPDATAPQTVPGEKLKAMVELLAGEAGFLVERKVRDAIDNLAPEEAELAQAESMLRALGVQDEADVAALVAHFFVDREDHQSNAPPPPHHHHTYDEGDDDGAEAGRDAARDLAGMIQPDDVIKAIQRFVDDRRQRSGVSKAQRARDAAADTSAVAAQREQLEERDFWNRLGDVVANKTFDVWTQLEKHLQQYNAILHQRATAIDDCKNLTDQNAQLKQLLDQYLRAKVNDDLIVPPSDTIHLPTHG